MVGDGGKVCCPINSVVYHRYFMRIKQIDPVFVIFL
jgi:hypothetical protein